MIRETKVPAIPDIRDDNLKDVLRAIKATLDVREGSVGDPLDQGVTLRDLVDLNVANQGGTTTTAAGGMLPVVSVNPRPVDNYNPASDLTIPPAPTNLRAKGGFTNVFLEWNGAPYRNHDHTEIWRAAVDDLGQAVLVGVTSASVYADAASTDTTYFYWIRFVSSANITGPYNSTSGTVAHTAIDVSTAIKAISDDILNSQFYADLGARITATETGITSLTNVTASSAKQVNTLASVVSGHSAAIEVAQSSVDGLRAQYSVKIDNNGHVSGFGLSSTTTNGKPTSAFIVRADRFAIAGAYDNTDPLGTLTPSKVPFMVLTTPQTINGKTYPAGTWIDTAFIANATIGTAQINDLTADKITTGTLTAAISINTGKIYGGVDPNGYSLGTLYTGTGFFLGQYGGTYQFFVGSPTKNLLWDGTDLTVRGTVYASAGSFTGSVNAAAGYIGGNVIDSAGVKSPYFTAGSSGWAILNNGTAEFNSAVFRGTLDIKSGSSGARMQMTNEVIKVFDANGTLRVRIGNTSA